MKREIVSREVMATTKPGRTSRWSNMTLRKLRCGHEQVEPHGSKAKLAKFAMCTTCDRLFANDDVIFSDPKSRTNGHMPDPVD